MSSLVTYLGFNKRGPIIVESVQGVLQIAQFTITMRGYGDFAGFLGTLNCSALSKCEVVSMLQLTKSTKGIDVYYKGDTWYCPEGTFNSINQKFKEQNPSHIFYRPAKLDSGERYSQVFYVFPEGTKVRI